MADLLRTGLSGLLAFQQALEVTGHNIANANTPGYSREVVQLAARTPDPLSNGWVGNGVDVATVQRQYNNFLATQAQASTSSFQQLDTFVTQANQINNLFADSSTGISATLQKFFNAAQTVANTPASIPARQALLGQAQGLATQLQTFDSQLRGMDTQINGQVGVEVATINSLAASIASLNGKVASGLANTGQPPNDLIDQRDQAISELAKHVNVSTVAQADGTVNVSIGNGQSLVLGTQASRLTTLPDKFDASRQLIALQTPSGAVDITANLTGGAVGGLLSFRTQMLDPTRNELGQLSVSVAQLANQQNRAGTDLSGALGQDIFAIGPVGVLAAPTNSNTASIAVTRSNLSGLTAADYVLKSGAGGWTMTRTDNGATVALSGAGTIASPLQGEGLSIVVTGVPTAGDQFEIQPTRAAAAGLAVVMTDPTKIAASSPIITAAAAGNTGSGQISAGTVLTPSNPLLQTSTSIVFTSATTYSVNGGASVAYTSGANIDVNGWRVQISGAPATGDTFTVGANSAASGDNSNALQLAAILQQPALVGGTRSINDLSGQLLSSVGVATSQAQAGRDAQSAINQQDLATASNVSGVNLDEEAANMLRYQQAYQASAEVIRTASALFATLIAAVKG
jgi:flagellar hook-associated protein 1